MRWQWRTPAENDRRAYTGARTYVLLEIYRNRLIYFEIYGNRLIYFEIYRNRLICFEIYRNRFVSLSVIIASSHPATRCKPPSTAGVTESCSRNRKKWLQAQYGNTGPRDGANQCVEIIWSDQMLGIRAGYYTIEAHRIKFLKFLWR
jgi:hypothetical protein